jgi:hypothetical protein
VSKSFNHREAHGVFKSKGTATPAAVAMATCKRHNVNTLRRTVPSSDVTVSSNVFSRFGANNALGI